MARKLMSILILAAALALTGCSSRGDVDLSLLEAATTPEQEAAAFAHLRDNAASLGLIGFDEAGEKLKGEEQPWTGRLVRVELRVNGKIIPHEMIDPANISVLVD